MSKVDVCVYGVGESPRFGVNNTAFPARVAVSSHITHPVVTAGSGGSVNGVAFGAFCGPDTYPSTGTKANWRARTTALFGVSQLPVERLYNQGSWAVPNVGHPLMLTWDPDPVAVAGGTLDGQIDTFLQGLFATGHKIWLGMFHEADLGKQPGADMVAAHQHLQARRNALGISATDIPIGQITTSGTLYTNQPKIDTYQWAGQDFVGFDCYLRPNTVKTADLAFGPIIDYAASRGKPLIVGEMSLGKTGAGGGFTATEWNTEVPNIISMLRSGNCDAACWFETIKQESAGVADWRVEPYPPATAAYAQAVQTG